MRPTDIVAVVRTELQRRGLSPRRAAREVGLPDNAIRYLIEGRDIKTSRLAEITNALGLEFYVGPPRTRPMPWSESDADLRPDERRVASAVRAPPASGSAVVQLEPTMPGATPRGIVLSTDPRLHQALAVLAESFERLNERGREDLLVRLWAAFPDLKERADVAAGRGGGGS